MHRNSNLLFLKLSSLLAFYIFLLAGVTIGLPRAVATCDMLTRGCHLSDCVRHKPLGKLKIH